MEKRIGCIITAIITTIIIFFLINPFLGLGTLVIGMIFLIIKELREKKKEELDNQIDLNSDNKKAEKDVTQMTGKKFREHLDELMIKAVKYEPITEKYFNLVNDSIDKLVLFMKNVCKTNIFVESMNECIQFDYKINDEFVEDINEKIFGLFLTDLIKCHLETGHTAQLGKKEGFGLLLFVWKHLYPTEAEVFNYLSIKKSHQHFSTCTTYIEAMEKAIKTLALPKQTFLIAKVLARYDEKLRQEYFVKLYRYSSVVSKADNTITPHETKWLNDLVTLTYNPNAELTDDIPEENNIVCQELMEEEKRTESNESNQDADVSAGTILVPGSLNQLNDLIGLETIKIDVRNLSNLLAIQQKRKESGMKNSKISYHCVFIGNPGTGKTTVARILAGIYKEMGILKKGHLVETDRSGLVAEYVGQTAVKTNRIIDKAMGGVLFIDEAYSLVSKGDNDYGKEAIATLLKRMEDNRDSLVVILAGYNELMCEFIDSNPGLQSRFNRYFHFPDYTVDELLEIFEFNLKSYEYSMTSGAKIKLRKIIEDAVETKSSTFGNARYIRNLFEKTIEHQANRLASDPIISMEKLSMIQEEDVKPISSYKTKRRQIGFLK